MEALWSSKFAKAITGPGSPWETVVGHDIEIVPLTDPAGVKPGESLKVRVMFHGKPHSGGEVERGDGTTVVVEKDIPRFTTDADGVVTIPIVKSGPAAAGHRSPCRAVCDARPSECGPLHGHPLVFRWRTSR